MVDVAASVFTNDAGSTPSVVLTSLISNEADNGDGDGNTFNDIKKKAAAKKKARRKKKAKEEGYEKEVTRQDYPDCVIKLWNRG